MHANSPAEVPARLEALAALGGLDRAALHSQMAAACQVVLHSGRDRSGRRHLGEIAILRRGPDALVCAETVWRAQTGLGPGAPMLRELLAARGRS